jgi:hypothetical protein
MSSKYVPPVLRDSVKYSTLVNTSLPAKDAPKLVPGTLASLTSNVTSSFKEMNLEKVSIYKNQPKSASLTEDDFPTLGSKPAAKPVVKLTMNFAEKAREWAVKQKEDERIAAEEAEKERARINVERMMKEKAENEEKLYRKTLITLASAKKANEWDRYDDRNDELSYDEDEPYESPLEEEEEEEEEQDEYQSHWDGRRYRDEY